MVWLREKNRTLIELTTAMLIDSDAPSNFWGEAILTACRVLNRVPHRQNSHLLSCGKGISQIWDILRFGAVWIL